MVLEINGVDIMPYIAHKGIKWQRADVDGSNAGRAMDGTMIRDRIATKIRFDITCRPMRSSELSTLLQLLQPEYILVSYTDPINNKLTMDTFYSNNIPASLYGDSAWGETWHEFSFPLIQK